MTAEDMEEILMDAIYWAELDDDVTVTRSKDADRRGLVVKVGGEEFRVAIVRSR